jgi:hypothetical protein
VAVTVALDRPALAAVGGQAALTAQLQDADLVAAGWTVTGPQAGPGSTTVISASHPFATPAQASALVGELAGSGPDASRPFRLSLAEHRTFWRTDTTLTGAVDLTCGLACFGDSGLKGVLGSPVGVNPSPLESAAGQSPDQVFAFSLSARLAGSVISTNASSRQDGTLQWTPRLGQTLELAAVTRTWNESRIKTFAIAGGVLVIVLLVLLGLGIVRWRRRRRQRRKQPEHQAGRRARRKGSGKEADTVAPHV